MTCSLPSSSASFAVCSFLHASCYNSLSLSAFKSHWTVLSSMKCAMICPVAGPPKRFQGWNTLFNYQSPPNYFHLFIHQSSTLMSLLQEVFSDRTDILHYLYYNFSVCNYVLQFLISAMKAGTSVLLIAMSLMTQECIDTYEYGRDIRFVQSSCHKRYNF